MSRDSGRSAVAVPFPEAARAALENEQLRSNIRRATSSIRARRGEVVAEVSDWEELREAGRALKDAALQDLDGVLLWLEASVTRAGGVVHWARDGAEANAIVVDLVRAAGASEVVKVKSLATDEIQLNDALERAGLSAIETDLAELICQLAGERPSHLLVPAIHKNRTEIRDLFRESFGQPDLSDDPFELAEAARLHLRAAFLRARVAISGANFAVAETGTICVVESEGNGRMCTTLPETLITVMGIEKAIREWRDLEVFLQLLPRSATGERMNPYTSLWTGVVPGDGPSAFHLVLLDNGRSRVLADEKGRPALRCIRCSACLNICPVYRQTGGHAYHTVYAGPIGAILQPQLSGETGQPGSLPFASSLCGACYDVCPVKIDIPSILVHERVNAVAAQRQGLEGVLLRRLARLFLDRERYERAQRLGRALQRPAVRGGRLRWFAGPLKGWGASRTLPALPEQTFREWWETRDRGA
ncbi:MAG: lactate utilization protein [Actinobacteria bacterium]|nr:MAG: lactate utilization protein [Actinomycetota bacterium]